MTTIRAFIAVRLPTPVEHALGEMARMLALRVPRGAVRWVRPERIHLTLRFLGETPVARLPLIIAAMDSAATSVPWFTLQLGAIGCFPHARRPRVIWVGLSGQENQLFHLKLALDEQLATLGLPPEARPFRAHLTLGRVNDAQATADIDWTTDVPPLALPVTAISLIESQLRPDGPVYTERHVSPLQQVEAS